jgi:hypothetical protein
VDARRRRSVRECERPRIAADCDHRIRAADGEPRERGPRYDLPPVQILDVWDPEDALRRGGGGGERDVPRQDHVRPGPGSVEQGGSVEHGDGATAAQVSRERNPAHADACRSIESGRPRLVEREDAGSEPRAVLDEAAHQQLDAAERRREVGRQHQDGRLHRASTERRASSQVPRTKIGQSTLLRSRRPVRCSRKSLSTSACANHPSV